MTYSLQPTNVVVETSFSTAPDDLSEASVLIEGAPQVPENLALADLQHVDFTLPETLTLRPGDVTPVARNHRDWEFGHLGGMTFRAVPKHPLSMDLAPWGFLFRDIPVTTTPGATAITVGEKWSGRDSYQVAELPIRKIRPKLRIDWFRVVSPSGRAATTHDVPVQLDWGTTGAESVFVYGPGIDQEAATGRDARNDTVTAAPETTATYTLIAATPGFGHAVAQLTVTVTDQTKVADLAVSTEATGLTVDGDLRTDRLQVANAIGGDLTINNTAGTDHLVVDEEVEENLEVRQAVMAERLSVTGEVRSSQSGGGRLWVTGTVRAPVLDLTTARDGDEPSDPRLLDRGRGIVGDVVTGNAVDGTPQIEIGEWTIGDDDGQLVLSWSGGGYYVIGSGSWPIYVPPRPETTTVEDDP